MDEIPQKWGEGLVARFRISAMDILVHPSSGEAK